MRALIGAFLAALLVCGAQAQDVYPNKPVRMIVPFGAGGPGDIFARLIAQKLSDRLGQQFFIENRAGAGGNIGAGAAARATPDGYTLLVGSSTVWVNASLYPSIPYDPVKDFDPIIIAATSPEVLVVNPAVPANNVQELIALVRAGKYNNFAMPGAGTPPHLSTELFKMSLKLDFVIVPFGGGGPMVQSVVAGHVPVAFSALPAASSQIKAGLLRALAVTSAKRISIMPDGAGTGRSWRARPGAGGAARSLGAAWHAARHHRSALRRDQQDRRDAADAGQDGGHRIHSGFGSAGRVRGAHQGRHAEVGEADSRRQHPALIAATSSAAVPLGVCRNAAADGSRLAITFCHHGPC